VQVDIELNKFLLINRESERVINYDYMNQSSNRQ
jgi:hypothetical protein